MKKRKKLIKKIGKLTERMTEMQMQLEEITTQEPKPPIFLMAIDMATFVRVTGVNPTPIQTNTQTKEQEQRNDNTHERHGVPQAASA